MSIKQWLAETTKQLQQADIETARLDCLVLLEDATGKSRAWLLAHDDEPLLISPSLKQAVMRRLAHEPLAYIRGFAEFYGRRFDVTPDVLVPRPETEAIIDMALKLLADEPAPRVADIGTGSGCIGVTLALELPIAHVYLSDVYTNVYTLATHNAEKLGAITDGGVGDLLLGLPDKPYTLVAANLPYVPDNYTINRAAGHEPAQALFSGPDGLAHYLRFWQQAASRPIQHVLTESLPMQHHANAGFARAAGYTLTDRQGFIQQFSKL